MDANRIEKKVILKATRERVWRAISDSARFGTWFGVEIDGPFVAGKEVIGKIIPTKVDPEVARLQEPYRGLPMRVVVERIEPMTLVTFELAEAEGGTLLTITESGFEQIPLEHRAKAMEGNDAGWTHQTKLIEKYLALEERS